MQLRTVSGYEDYPISVRHWTPDAEPAAQVIILHGVVSHSEWLRPFAERLQRAGYEVVCPDRRGAGLNRQQAGDAPGVDALVGDVDGVRLAFHRDGVPVHLAGFCWGATYAIRCIDSGRSSFRSLLLIAPSVFPAADIGDADLVSGDSPDACLEPHVPIDRFTAGPAYENYIIPDPLRTRLVSPRLNAVMIAMNQLLAARWAKLEIPTLMILARDDRLSDNAKHERAFESLRSRRKKLLTLNGAHGLQFDAPDSTVRAIADWLNDDNAEAGGLARQQSETDPGAEL